ncbi:MAG: family metallopeptidase [Chitinophagaceae bacterium]|nr:family metallopeptidase [Chitinophagaceae bacterium]
MKNTTCIPRYAKHDYPIFIITAFFCILGGCATKPPHESGTFKQTDLIELIKLDPGIKLDIRYATNNNLVGKPVYTEARAFLQRPAAQALVNVNQELKTLGYGLLVFDGYRPWSVTKIFWDITSKENKKFVADPQKGSKHNRGCAVDLSLYDLATGKEIEMTGQYDEMSDRSYPYYTGGTEAQHKMRDLLRTRMEANGFKVYDYEWWHFDYQDWQSYRITNIPFSKIKQ